MTSKVKGTEGIEFPDSTVQGSAALTAFIGANQSKTPNGYQKLPGGLIIQWGAATTDASGIAVVTFPIPFPTECLQTLATAATPIRTMSAAGPLADASATFYSHNDSGVGAAADFRWLAIGY